MLLMIFIISLNCLNLSTVQCLCLGLKKVFCNKTIERITVLKHKNWQFGGKAIIILTSFQCLLTVSNTSSFNSRGIA